MVDKISYQKKAEFLRAMIRFFPSLYTIFLISCTTIEPGYMEPKRHSFEETLNSALNRMTYDEALMTWGEPTSVFQGDEIFIATWGNAESGSAVFPIGNTWFAMPIEEGWKLQLSFRKNTRTLVSWKYDKW